MNDLASVTQISDRYALGEVIGGAAAIVAYQARDVLLERDVVLHTLAPSVLASPDALRHFAGSARELARLRHPGIPAVYDLGTLPDGRPYMTTCQGIGVGFDEAVEAFHERGGSAARLVEALRNAARAVAHAHGCGVVHGDLDPESVRLGEDGSVVVADWGTAGERSGHPAYWAPEVAHAHGAHGSEQSDVYALGAMLYLLLTGAPPYEGSEATVPEAVRAAPPEDPGARVGNVPRPAALVDVCRKAMSREPSQRYGGAGALAEALTTWIERRAQRDRARARVAEARALLPKLASLRSWAQERELLARAVLESTPPHAPLESKQPGWALEEEADALRKEAQVVEAAIEQRLCAAVAADPALPAVHEMMASLWRGRHLEAEADGRGYDQVIAEAHLRAHTQALPALSKSKGALLQYLEGYGALTLHTEPAGASVFVERLEVRQRRLVAQPAVQMGATPLTEVPLRMGRYRIRVEAPGHVPVVLSVHVPRGHHVSAVRPGSEAPVVVHLPPEGTLSDHEVVVPAGWFTSGGDPEARNGLPRQQVWVDSFVMQRWSVTHAEFLAFVEDIRQMHGLSAALQHAPRDPGPTGENRRVLYDQAPDGQLCLGTTAEGDSVQAEWPVTFVTCRAAMAYAAWYAEQTGLPWRLPFELEWEKAARGADGRTFPWGVRHDGSFAIGLAGRDPLLPAPVDSAPIDTSPYGVRGLGGNAQDWCLDAFHEAGPTVVDGKMLGVPAPLEEQAVHAVRGGGFAVDATWARCASRGRREAITRGRCLGFRLVRSLA